MFKLTRFNPLIETKSCLGYSNYIHDYFLHKAENAELNNFFNIFEWLTIHATDDEYMDFMEMLKQELKK